MNHRRWDIVFLRTEEKEKDGHPAVVLSSDDIMADAKQTRFNVVVGTNYGFVNEKPARGSVRRMV